MSSGENSAIFSSPLSLPLSIRGNNETNLTIKLQKPSFKEDNIISKEIDDNLQESPKKSQKDNQNYILKKYFIRKKQQFAFSPKETKNFDNNLQNLQLKSRKESLLVLKENNSISSQNKKTQNKNILNGSQDPTFFIEESKKLLKKV